MTDEKQEETSASPAEADATAGNPEGGRSPAAEDSAQEDVQEEKSSGGGKGIALLALLVAVIALLFSGYLFMNQKSAGASQEQALAGLKSEVSEAPRRIEAAVDSKLSAMGNKVRGVDQRVDRLQDTVTGVTREISTLTSADRTDWMLAEVEYLLRLANQRVLMEDDVAGAEVILQSADRILLELDDSRLHKVRAAVTKDISALRAAGELDTAGIYLRLAAAAGQIDGLPLIVASDEMRKAQAEAKTAGTGLDEAESVEEAVGRVWERLRGLVVVRHRDDPVRPLLPPSQEYYLRQNLRMLLGQAQLALLRNSQPVYRTSLESARDWLRRYFPADAPAVQAMQMTIAELLRFDVGPRNTDVSGSLNALREFLAGRHWKSPTSKAAPGKATEESSS